MEVKLKFPWFAPTDIALKEGQGRDVRDDHGRSLVSVSGGFFRAGVHKNVDPRLREFLPKTAVVLNPEEANAELERLHQAAVEALEETVRLQKGGPDPNNGFEGHTESSVEIPDDWRDLPWPDLRSLASAVSAYPIKSKEDAVVAIEDELADRQQEDELADSE